MKLSIETDREVDGQWIADIAEYPGVTVYGATEAEAIHRAVDLALAVEADRAANP